jgi:hypothetical protein
VIFCGGEFIGEKAGTSNSISACFIAFANEFAPTGSVLSLDHHNRCRDLHVRRLQRRIPCADIHQGLFQLRAADVARARDDLGQTN